MMASDREQGMGLLRIVLLAVCLVVAICIPAVIWMAATGAIAAVQLKSAKVDIAAVQAAIARSDTAAAQSLVPSITKATSSAHAWTSGPVWFLATKVPVVGSTVDAVKQSVAAVDVAAAGALGPLTGLSAYVLEGKLRDPGGKINIALLEQLQAPAAQAAVVMERSVALSSSVSEEKVVSPVRQFTTQTNSSLQSLQRQVQSLADATAVLPSMLGKTGIQRYFVGFASPAEIRGTGGFLGTYAILRANRGVLSIEKVGSDTDLKDFKAPVLNLGSDYSSTYGSDTAEWSGMNLSPHFPFAAQQWIEGWRRQTGQQLQGAIQVDPETLSYLVAATQPIKLPNGRQLTATQVGPYLTNGIYLDFANDNAGRKAFQVAIASAELRTLMKGSTTPAQLVPAFARAAAERRLLVYSTDEQIERILEPWPISGTIDTLPGPYAMLVLNNTAANKADYYLNRSLVYNSTGCGNGQTHTQVTATLTNSLPPGRLPAIITGRGDVNAKGAPAGSTRVSAEVLLPMGSRVTSVTVAGKPVFFSPVNEVGRPGIVVSTDLLPNKPLPIVVALRESASDRQPRIPVQPMAKPQSVTVSYTPCRITR